MVAENETRLLKLTIADLETVDELMKRNSRTLGFLTLEALEGYLERGDVVGIKANDGTLKGYLLFATHRAYFRVTHLCISEDFRGKGLARRFIEHLKEVATTQKIVRLACRNDFPAHHMWPKLGFVPVDERPGRSKDGLPLTVWRLTLALDDQLALFRANVSDTVLDVVVDAQVFFDLDEPDNDATAASKVLISDPFVDSVRLWFTDELLSEIGRNSDANRRAAARDRTRELLEAKYDPLVVDALAESLKQILPSDSQSQQSDINHLAKAAASEVNVFVTRDRGLLNRHEQIANLVGLQVLSPTQLILRLSELSDRETNQPDRVSGLGLEWRRLTSGELADFPFNSFLDGEEPLRQLRRKVDSLLLDTVPHELEVLWYEGVPIALRGVRYESERKLTVTIGRVARIRDRSLVGQFLISDSIYKAMRQNRSLVKFEPSALPVILLHGLSDMGFTRTDDHFVRFCFPSHRDREEVLAEIQMLSPEAVDDYQKLSPFELERSCSPLTTETDQNYFLIPIRPRYALNLFDRRQSAQDMFGGNSDVLMLWRNVYYRKAAHRRMLRAPGRILWYVSRNPKAIVAVSHLDRVEIDTAKELFRQFKKIGTLNSEDLYEMCGREPLRELMAIQFSHTFPLDRPVALEDIRKAFREEGVGLAFPSPSRMTWNTFRKLFELGYPERS